MIKMMRGKGKGKRKREEARKMALNLLLEACMRREEMDKIHGIMEAIREVEGKQLRYLNMIWKRLLGITDESKLPPSTTRQMPCIIGGENRYNFIHVYEEKKREGGGGEDKRRRCEMYVVEVIYHKDAPLFTDQAIEEEISGWRLTDNGIRDGIDGGEGCFDVFLTDGDLSQITATLISYEAKKLIIDFHIYEIDWIDIKQAGRKIL